MTGWNMPPGCNVSDIPGNGALLICDVCGLDAEGDCICPECPICGEAGNPLCYDDLWTDLNAPEYRKDSFNHRNHIYHGHRLIRSFGQVAFRAQADWYLEEQLRLYWLEYPPKPIHPDNDEDW